MDRFFVRGRDKAYVYTDGLRAAHTFKFPFLQNAEQFGLGCRRHVADFIENNRSAIHDLKFPLFLGNSAGKGPFLASEQLTLQKTLRNGDAVDLDKRSAFTKTVFINACRDQLFPRTVLTMMRTVASVGATFMICPKIPLIALL